MAIAPFSLNGTINPTAIVEQLAALQALYLNQNTTIQEIWSNLGGGQELSYNFSLTGIPVSYVIGKQGNNVYIVCNGTSNWRQVVGDIIGVFTSKWEETNSQVHSFFYLQAKILENALQAALPTPWTNYHFWLSGHSLGAAAAWVLAVNLAQWVGSENVSVMTFGCPKSTIASFNAVLPVDNFHVVYRLDPIVRMPPKGALNLLPGTGSILSLFYNQNWKHFGRLFQLNDTNAISEIDIDTTDAGLSFSDISNGQNYHPVKNYMSAAEQVFAYQAPPGTDAWLFPTYDTLRLATSPQTDVQDFSSTAVIDIPNANATIFNSPNGGVLNQSNLQHITVVSGNVQASNSGYTSNMGATGVFSTMANYSGVYKVSFIFTDGTYGNSESHYYQDKTNPSLDTVLNVARTGLAAKRQQLLGTVFEASPPGSQSITDGSPALNWIRVSDAFNPKLSLLSQELKLFGLNYVGNSPSVFPSLHVSKQMFATDSQTVGNPPTARVTRSNIMICFPPSNVVVNEKYNIGASLGGPGPVSFHQLWRDYMNELAKANSPWGVLGLTQNLTVGTGKATLSNFTRLASGLIQFTATYAAGAQIAATGDVVRLTHANTRGWNGTYSITQTSAVAPYTYTINSYFNSALVLPTFARMQRIRFANGTKDAEFYPYTSWDQQPPTLRKRNPGRAFKQATFRRRKARAV